MSGEYGRIVSDHLSTIPNGDIFLDIGANHGVFSLMVALQKPKSTVISFEPNPFIYRSFLHNITLNKLRNIVPFHGAVGPDDGLVCLAFDPLHSGKAHVSDDASADLRVPIFNPARMPVLSQIVEGKTVHVKIDVDVFEMNVLLALMKAPWFGNVKTLVLEIDEVNLNKFGHSVQNIYEALANFGYSHKFGEQKKHYDEIFYAGTSN